VFVHFFRRSARSAPPDRIRRNFLAIAGVARCGVKAISMKNAWSILISVSILSSIILGAISIEVRRVRPAYADYKPLLASICVTHLEIPAPLERVKYAASDVDQVQAGTRGEGSWLASSGWIYVAAVPFIVALFALIAYLKDSQGQLRLANDKRRELGGMLINAQEKERRRIASEIHDDFSQRMAILALGLENVAEIVEISPREAAMRLRQLLGSTNELSTDLHTLSHRLHSSTLESLGVVLGISALCREFAIQHTVAVDFNHEGVPRSVTHDVALCLFRIVQEGLRNFKRHSGANRAGVRLRKQGDELVVSVSDHGVGFDMHDLVGRECFGLRSMQERAHLAGGRFEIHSEAGKGTLIEARVPLPPKTDLRLEQSTRHVVGALHQ
jgi:signal transduction histidine kinase